MTARRLPEPRLPGLSLELELPRWLPKALRIGLGLTIVFIIGVAVLASTRSPGDRSWASPALYVDEATRTTDGVWQYRVLVTAGTESADLADGWSVVLSSGGVIPATSTGTGNLPPGESAEVVVDVRYEASPWPGEPIALRLDPHGRVGTTYPLSP